MLRLDPSRWRASYEDLHPNLLAKLITRDRYEERCGDRDVAYRIRDRIVETECLCIERYSLVNLRNAIIHGKDTRTGLDLVKAEKIVYRSAQTIEHRLAPKIRLTLRTFLENPDNFINNIVND